MERHDIYTFIEKCRPLLIQQLQKELVYVMYERNVLTEEEYLDILSYERREDQIICILDKLPKKGGENFNTFSQYISDWYSWIIRDCYMNRLEAQDYDLEEIERILNECDVPPLPSRHVNRKEEFVKVCKCLHEVKRHEYVVVYGMRGCGKSTLIAEVLRNSYSLTVDAFKKKVYWLTIGRESSVEEFTVLQGLCAKLISDRGYNNMQTLPTDSISAKKFLKDRFRSEELEHSLLILDDVSSISLIDAFDVGCKILITTDDEDIMRKTKKRIHSVKVSEGFTEEETLRLFSKSIGSQQLPNQAKHIHSICKGFPLTISLINSQLEEHKEDVLINTDRWNVYVSKLKKEDVCSAIGCYDQHRSEQVTSLYKAIGISISSLSSNLQNFYQDFALFAEDVNITPEVLSTLWEVTKIDVQDIMKGFEKKCLVVRAWNHSRNSYIYCVHDLLLHYLKRQFSEIGMQALHQRLIYQYKKKFGNDFSNFPVEDNYILLYIGYHLKEANLVDEFPNLYYNLKFIEKKIVYCGTADLLHDFEKYKESIDNDAENATRYRDFVRFIKRIGIKKSISNSNIIQFALCEHKESAVYKTVLQLMRNSENTVPKNQILNRYFEFLTDFPNENSSPMVRYLREEILTATFVSDENVIIANSSGAIKLINIISNHTLISFKGHTEKVTLLQLSKNRCYFLSASNDCTVRIWFLNENFVLENSCSDKPRTPSPQLKQSDWCDPWSKQRCSGESAVAVLDKHVLPIKYAQFSNNGNMVVSTSSDFKLIIWKFGFEKKKSDLILSICGFDVIPVNEIIECCDFSHDDEYILCAAQKGIIFIYQSSDGNLVHSLATKYKIKSMSIIPDVPRTSALILGENYFYVLDIVPEKLNSTVLQNKQEYRTIEHKREHKRDDHYIYGAVSWDGKYVAIASSNCNILIYEIQSGKEISKFNENSGKICGLSWCHRNCTLLTFYHNHILKLWHVRNHEVSNNCVKLKTSVFDAVWMKDHNASGDKEGLLVTAALNNNNQIIVYYDLQEQKILNSKSDVEILQICVCPNNGDIVYSCEDGSIFNISLNKWFPERIMHVPCTRVHKLKVFCYDELFLVMVMVETELNTFSLVGWLKQDGTDDIKGNEITYELQSNYIIDFTVDFKTNSLYTVKNNHELNIYDILTATLKHKENNLTGIDCTEFVKFSDISCNFSNIATGNNEILLLRVIGSELKNYIKFTNAESPTTCKFTKDESNIIIGLHDGRINIYELKGCSQIFSFPPENVGLSPYKFSTGAANELFVSPVSSHFLVMFDREIALYELSEDIKLNAMVHLYVNKIVCSPTFTKAVTIDTSGYLKLLKIPKEVIS